MASLPPSAIHDHVSLNLSHQPYHHHASQHHSHPHTEHSTWPWSSYHLAHHHISPCKPSLPLFLKNTPWQAPPSLQNIPHHAKLKETTTQNASRTTSLTTQRNHHATAPLKPITQTDLKGDVKPQQPPCHGYTLQPPPTAIAGVDSKGESCPLHHQPLPLHYLTSTVPPTPSPFIEGSHHHRNSPSNLPRHPGSQQTSPLHPHNPNELPRYHHLAPSSFPPTPLCFCWVAVVWDDPHAL